MFLRLLQHCAVKFGRVKVQFHEFLMYMEVSEVLPDSVV